MEATKTNSDEWIFYGFEYDYEGELRLVELSDLKDCNSPCERIFRDCSFKPMKLCRVKACLVEGVFDPENLQA